MIYRKMYLMILEIIFYNIVSSLGITAIGGSLYFLFKHVFHLSNDIILIIASIVFVPLYVFGCLSFGLFSNWLYFVHVKNCVHKNEWTKAGVSRKALTITLISIALVILSAAVIFLDEIKSVNIEPMKSNLMSGHGFTGNEIHNNL